MKEILIISLTIAVYIGAFTALSYWVYKIINALEKWDNEA